MGEDVWYGAVRILVDSLLLPVVQMWSFFGLKGKEHF
jgi:hypothetical protein